MTQIFKSTNAYCGKTEDLSFFPLCFSTHPLSRMFPLLFWVNPARASVFPSTYTKPFLKWIESRWGCDTQAPVNYALKRTECIKIFLGPPITYNTKPSLGSLKMWNVTSYLVQKPLLKTNFCSVSNRSLTGLNSKPTEEKNSQLLVLQPMNRISAIEGEKASNAKSKRERLLPSIFPSACGNASAVRRLLDSHPCSRPFFPILCRRSVYEKIFWWEKKWLLDIVSRGGY